MKQVTIIIPTKNIEYLKSCVLSICQYKTNISYDILIMHTGNNEAINSFIDGYNLQSITYSFEFNYSKVNNLAVQQSSSEYLLFLNDDTEIKSDYWLDTMIHNYKQDTGALGVTLLYPNNTIQSCGDFVGLSKYWRGSVIAWNNKIQSATHMCVDSVTGACLLIKRKTFLEVGGFNEKYPLDYNDIDLGLRLLKKGYKNIIVSSVYITHKEFGTRQLGYNLTAELLNQTWNKFVFWYKLNNKLNILSKFGFTLI